MSYLLYSYLLSTILVGSILNEYVLLINILEIELKVNNILSSMLYPLYLDWPAGFTSLFLLLDCSPLLFDPLLLEFTRLMNSRKIKLRFTPTVS